MRQTYRSIEILTGMAACAMIAGCVVPHNNTLVFAVNRKIGVDITPTNATSAGLTIGYSENQFAWVPLWANGPDGIPFVDCIGKNTDDRKRPDDGKDTRPYCAKSPKFIGKDAEGARNGRDEDAYSVFASFGGAASGSAGSENKADLKIASFFATGIAAQNLAEGDPSKLVGTDTRGTANNPYGALLASLKTYFEASALNGKVTEACVGKLNLKKYKLDTVSADVKNRASDLAADFVAKAVRNADASKMPEVKYQADVLTLQFKDEKASAKPTAPETADDAARKAVCGAAA